MQTTQHARGPAAERSRTEAHPCAHRRGSILVEFALVSLAFYLILAGTLEVGRMITTAQIVQNAARTAARELALMPLPATIQWTDVLRCPTVRARIYDTELLAVRTTGQPIDTSRWPVVNRMLYPLMVVSDFGGDEILHYPGAVVQSFGGGLTVKVPHVVSRGADGVESIRWVDVIEQVRTSSLDPNSGPFSVASSGPERGLVALRVNCPYQAATMSAYQPVDPTEEFPVNEAILANDAGVTELSAPGGILMGGSNPDGTYGGRYGLGTLHALNKKVRPFRRLISGQAVFRREVFHAGPDCP
jgi:hypothetical protein